MGETLSQPYTAPMASSPNTSAQRIGRKPQCAPSAAPTTATATKTPAGFGAATGASMPSATASCASARKYGRGTPARSAASEASPPHSRPRQLHTENTETSAVAADGPDPAAVDTASTLFTSVIAAPDEKQMVTKRIHCSAFRSDSPSVNPCFEHPRSGGGPGSGRGPGRGSDTGTRADPDVASSTGNRGSSRWSRSSRSNARVVLARVDRSSLAFFFAAKSRRFPPRRRMIHGAASATHVANVSVGSAHDGTRTFSPSKEGSLSAVANETIATSATTAPVSRPNTTRRSKEDDDDEEPEDTPVEPEATGIACTCVLLG